MPARAARAPARRVHVVAAVLIDRRGRVLIAQRPPGKALAGAWEFPGGKVEPGESRAGALARELEEEIGLRIRDPRPLLRLTHRYPHSSVLLDVFIVRRFGGRLERRDAQALRWVSRAELAAAPLLPADRPILKLLALPARLTRSAAGAWRVLHPPALRSARARRGLLGAPLLGALCRTPGEARTLRQADFLVLRDPCPDDELEALCRATPRPVYAAALSLERAWALGASGVQAIV
ncbi:MAG TPA: (deoxy)nucleoside triphosphate pyrophosphohydrolase [Steroidobacteraceae bacterium]|nr:(deoxy)nucleoside triphosphate pyrophosphohydrolase [Steroidobacteraceae bacterium]